MDDFPFLVSGPVLSRPMELCQCNYIQLVKFALIYQDINLSWCVETLDIPIPNSKVAFGDVHFFGVFGVVPSLPSPNLVNGFPGWALTIHLHTDCFSRRRLFGTGYTGFSFVRFRGAVVILH